MSNFHSLIEFANTPWNAALRLIFGWPPVSSDNVRGDGAVLDASYSLSRRKSQVNTRFGITAGLALVIFIGVFTAMLALSVISPLGVQGADRPIDNDGQGESFQQGGMVTNVTVTNIPKEPGLTARYTVTFITGEVLQSNVDTIVFDIDSSVGTPVSIPADAIRISASAVTGGGQANQSVALSLDPAHRAGSEGRDIYTITVPDMDASESSGISSGIESIHAGAIVTVTNVNEPPPAISGDAEVSYPENWTGPVHAYTTADPESDSLTWSLAGDAAAKFNISGNGELTFRSAPDYENPADEGGDNVYNVTVQVSDGKNAAGDADAAVDAAISVTISVTDVTEDTTGGDAGTTP